MKYNERLKAYKAKMKIEMAEKKKRAPPKQYIPDRMKIVEPKINKEKNK